MKKTILFLSIIMSISAISFSFVKKPSLLPSDEKTIASIAAEPSKLSTAHDHTTEVESLSAAVYDDLKLNAKGMSKNVLNVAVRGYLTLKKQGELRNTDLLTVVDFSQSSRKKRFYLIDMKNAELVENTYVAHAKNSGVDMAGDFSNVIGSEKSSLGFYVTKGTYTGKHGLSLRLAGLEKGFNDNAEKRAIVVHGADYVNGDRVQSAYLGRSQGCPAVPMENYVQIINQIKNGSALFIYYPDTKYLNQSEILSS